MAEVVLNITGDAFGDAWIGVTEMQLSEGLGRCYRATLEVVTDSAALAPEQVVGTDVRIEWAEDGRVTTGFVEECRQLPGDSTYVSRYQLVLRPRLFKAAFSRADRIFLDNTVPDIVEQLLEQHSVAFEWRLVDRSAFPLRAFTVQYAETDLDFVSRLLEDEGISYFFTHDQSTEIVVMCDDRGAFEDVPVDPMVPYLETEGFRSERAVGNLSFTQTLPPKTVTVDGFSPGQPDKVLHGVAEGSGGLGELRLVDSGCLIKNEDGELVYDPARQERVARLRLEERISRATSGTGEGAVETFEPGRVFELTSYPTSSRNARYLLRTVDHEIRQSFVGARSEAVATAAYRNWYTFGSADVVHRPLRRTPQPVLSGVMRAVVESTGPLPDRDELGRYKLRMPFDRSEQEKATASCGVELARPFAGPAHVDEQGGTGGNSGFDFPLPGGTVVVWAALDGNLDRPVILGTLPSRREKAPFGKTEEVEHGVATPAGHKLLLKDTAKGWQLQAKALDGEIGVGFIESVSPGGPSRFRAGGAEDGRGVSMQCDEPQAATFLGRRKIEGGAFLNKFESRTEPAQASFDAGEVSEDHEGTQIHTAKNESSFSQGRLKVSEQEVTGLRLATESATSQWVLGKAGDHEGMLLETGEVVEVHGEQGCVLTATESIDAGRDSAAAAKKEIGKLVKDLAQDVSSYNSELSLNLMASEADEQLSAAKEPGVEQSEATADFVSTFGAGSKLWGPEACAMVMEQLLADGSAGERVLPGVGVLAPAGVHLGAPAGSVHGFGTVSTSVSSAAHLTVASHVAATVASMYGPALVRAQQGNLVLYSKKGAVGLRSPKGEAAAYGATQVLARAGTNKDKAPSISCESAEASLSVDKTKVTVEQSAVKIECKELTVDGAMVNQDALKMEIDAGKTFTVSAPDISLVPGG